MALKCNKTSEEHLDWIMVVILVGCFALKHLPFALT